MNDTFFPAPRAIGSVYPVAENPVPAAEIAVTFKVALPGLLIVTVTGLVVPVVTFPNKTGFGPTEICGSACVPVPVPESGTVIGVEEALLVMVMLPVIAPDEGGTKRAVNCPTPPGATFIGTEKAPLISNPGPDMFTAEIVKVVLPGLFSRTCVCDAPPTVTVPNAIGSGFTVSCACDAAPVPVNATVVAVVEALLAIVSVPLVAPVAVGANRIETITLWFVAIEIG